MRLKLSEKNEVKELLNELFSEIDLQCVVFVEFEKEMKKEFNISTSSASLSDRNKYLGSITSGLVVQQGPGIYEIVNEGMASLANSAKLELEYMLETFGIECPEKLKDLEYVVIPKENIRIVNCIAMNGNIIEH